jgi:YggT family protein
MTGAGPYFSRVTPVVNAISTSLDILRIAFLAVAGGLGVVCAIEWGVRTHRLSAFSPIARGSHRLLSPWIKHVERRVVRAGGLPSTAPLWALMAVVVAGILVLTALGFLRSTLLAASGAFSAGPSAVAHFVVSWVFTLWIIALVISVVATWFQLNPFGAVVRAARAITEPVLRPIRRVIPTFGMIDISPIVAYFAARILEALIHSLL